MPKIILNKKELDELNDALHYMKMPELKQLCEHYQLATKGNKIALIERILTYIRTGEVITPTQIPDISKAKKSKSYPLAPQTLMLYGSYKNDLKTRMFFKSLIGNHFHYTAFGVDWLKDRWMNGSPPTYAEFAEFWQKEYMQRKNKKPAPKKEWAYINFTQRYLVQHPHASKNEIIEKWEQERLAHVKKVKKLLRLNSEMH